MITLQELYSYLDQYLNCVSLPDFCKNGLQLEGAERVSKIGTAVTANLETIKKASELKVDALIVHHGLFWNQDPHEITGTKREKIKILIENDISLLAYHLPLDAHQEIGNNWKAAKDLGWKNLRPLYVKGIPLGVLGDIESKSQDEVIADLEQYYSSKAVCALGGGKLIKSLGLISGGAYKNLSDAKKGGADAFITGSYDLPAWDQAFEEKINFFALGHTATEKVGPKALATKIAELWEIETCFIDAKNLF